MLACSHFRADNGNPDRRLCDDVTKIPSGQLVCHFLLRVQEAADETWNSQRAWRPREVKASSCSGTCGAVCDGVWGGGGGRPLQVWTYLASGFSDDKMFEQQRRGSDSGIQRGTCLYTVRLNSVSSLTTNPPPSPPPGHWAVHGARRQSGRFHFDRVQRQDHFQERETLHLIT